MKIETILDAAMIAHQRLAMVNSVERGQRLWRQSYKFHNRILKMFAEKDEEIIFLNKLLMASENQINGYQSDAQKLERGIEVRNVRIYKRDKRIVELEGEVKRLEERMGVYRT